MDFSRIVVIIVQLFALVLSQSSNTSLPLPSIRLLGGNSFSGNVEVTYNGKTGPICDDKWNFYAAEVVCRMLGFSGANTSTTHNRFNGVTSNFMLNNVQCAGTELNIEYCPKGAWGQHNCARGEQAGVICSRPTVGLIAGDAHHGAVQVTAGARVGLVCGDRWTKAEADVTCRMLGYPEAVRSALYTTHSYPFLYGGVFCIGNETNLDDCSKRSNGLFGPYNCPGGKGAGVVCDTMVGVALVGGNTHAGAVEVTSVDGSKGVVCSDGWDDVDANVVCRMLGFKGSLSISDGGSFYTLTNTTSGLSGVNCTGDEKHLRECRYSKTTTCKKNKIAGLNCCSSVLNTPPVSDLEAPISGEIMNLTINNAEPFAGETSFLTMRCDARTHSSNISVVTLIHLSKVNVDGSLSPVAEYSAGTRGSIFTKDSWLNRTHAHTIGSLDLRDGVFLEVTIPTPLHSDSGKYRCMMAYLDRYYGVNIDTSESELIVWDLKSLSDKKVELDSDLTSCQLLCNTHTPIQPTATTTLHPTTASSPQADILDITISPPVQIIGQTHNMTVTCDARNHSSSLLVAALLQLNKVHPDGSLTSLVELISGSGTPTTVDQGLVGRSQSSGSLDIKSGVFLQLVLPNPGATDAGDYRCSMSFLGTHHGLQTDTADAEMKAFDLKAMLEDVRKVEGDLNACRERCFCK